jgi:hypothetical protein
MRFVAIDPNQIISDGVSVLEIWPLRSPGKHSIPCAIVPSRKSRLSAKLLTISSSLLRPISIGVPISIRKERWDKPLYPTNWMKIKLLECGVIIWGTASKHPGGVEVSFSFQPMSWQYLIWASPSPSVSDTVLAYDSHSIQQQRTSLPRRAGPQSQIRPVDRRSQKVRGSER